MKSAALKVFRGQCFFKAEEERGVTTKPGNMRLIFCVGYFTRCPGTVALPKHFLRPIAEFEKKTAVPV
jgi:hypothetical protein